MMEETMKAAGAGGGDLDSQLAELQKQGQTAMKEQKAAQAKSDAKLAEARLNAKQFDERYPANPEAFIAGRLREFLALSATVPAEAALVRRGGKMVFVDPALESKPEILEAALSRRPAVGGRRARSRNHVAGGDRTVRKGGSIRGGRVMVAVGGSETRPYSRTAA